MNNKGQLIQDPFLNEIRKEKIPVSIYLVNGIKLQGLIESLISLLFFLRIMCASSWYTSMQFPL